MEPGASDAGTASLAAFVAAPEWPLFRQTLIGLTDVTRSHFSKLVEVCWPSPLLRSGHQSPRVLAGLMAVVWHGSSNLERQAGVASCPEEGTQGLGCLTSRQGVLCPAS